MRGRYKVDETRNFCRYRQFEPRECVRNTFRTKQINPNLDLVMCRNRNTNKFSVQSILKRRRGNRRCLRN